MGKQIHIRSVFRQGALCLSPDRLPTHLEPLTPALRQLHNLCQTEGLTPAAAALGWICARYPQCGFIFGAESSAQVCENIQTIQTPLSESVYRALQNIAPPQIDTLLNPALWRIQL